MDRRQMALFSLKWNPFINEVPTEGLFISPRTELFCSRIERGLILEGGFALITGEPGSGKSVTLRILAQRLQSIPDLKVGALSHPSSNLADFYREMGDLFEVELRPHNRWGGFKVLRERWQSHMEGALVRPVLLIDEAQEMHPQVLNELRLLTSKEFDSRTLLTIIFAGDGRFPEKLRRDDLLPLGSRIRTRLTLEHASREELVETLNQLQKRAGNPSLMTAGLMQTLSDHAIGNYRVLTTMAAELLHLATEKEVAQMDESLYLEAFTTPPAIQPIR
ncbi:MAG TPA: ATP-binding protein [Gammaproteobacteria bacterium]|jgi:general secretion pathway protein A|nr:ATP-binding protein [Gammaproteobacteria bacterium]MBT7480719.1 ATP-binding protein [Gammaproteobacteria bacterium]HIJ23882.1 ATP-binding protein [Gammaproteobacteria bacterium]HIJ31701.1 ATP-binding protein [Gammaproteobacteria bacterium]